MGGIWRDLILVVLTCFHTMDGIQNSLFARQYLQEDLFFDRYVLAEEFVSNEKECVFLCMQRKSCRSYNLENRTGLHPPIKCILKTEALQRYSSALDGPYITGQKVDGMEGDIYQVEAGYDQCPFSAPSVVPSICPDFPAGGSREQCYSLPSNCCWDEDISVSGDIKCYINPTPNSEGSNKWTEVYAHQSDGSPIWGNLNTLIEHAKSGAHIRVVFNHYGDVNLSVLKETAYITEHGHVCLVPPPDFQKPLFNYVVYGTEKTSEWIFRKICTTGEIEAVQVSLGIKLFEDVSFEHQSVQWFVKALKNPVPVYLLNNGQAGGNLTELVEAHNNGLPFFPITEQQNTVIVRNPRVTYSAVNDQANTLRAFTWSVAMNLSSETMRFVNPDPYFEHEAFLHDGNRVVTKWLISKRQRVEPNSASQIGMDWFVDDGWESVYEHDSNGLPLQGTLSHLIKAINSGRRLRIVAVIEGEMMAFSLETWIVRDDTQIVWAFVTSRRLVSQNSEGRESEQVFPDSDSVFDEVWFWLATSGNCRVSYIPYAEWAITFNELVTDVFPDSDSVFDEVWFWLATSGYCRISYIPYAERTTTFNEEITDAKIMWLAEKSHTKLVYSVDSAGVGTGMVDELVADLTAGKELTLARDFNSGIFFSVPQSYEFNASMVTVTLTSEYALRYSGGVYFYQQNVYQTIHIYVTDGRHQMMRWYYGGEYRSYTDGHDKTHWFIRQ